MKKIFISLLFLTLMLNSFSQNGTTGGFFWENSPDNPYTVYFYASDDNTLAESYFWDFGDGTFSEEQNPVHTFSVVNQEGDSIFTFVVCLTTASSDQTTTSYCEEINFGFIYPEGCMAQFYYYFTGNDTIPGTDPDNLDYPVEYYSNIIQFQDYSYGNPTSWFWDFGDGTFSEEQNPIHEFNIENASEFTVCLTIASDSCSSVYCETVYFGNVYPEDCWASFYYYLSGSDVIVEGDSTNAGGEIVSNIVQFQDYSWGNPIAWHWDFGDGTFSEEQNPVHEYDLTLGNEFMVCLTIESDSCSSSYCEFIYLGNYYPEDCWASYYYMQENPEDLLTFSFYDLSWTNSDLTEYLWDFGDGFVSSEQNPVHTYSEEGIFTVCLTVSGSDDECYSTYCDYVFAGQNIFPVDSCQMYIYVETVMNTENNCDGLATAYLMDYNGMLIEDAVFEWSTQADGNFAENLCGDELYWVSATTPNGCSTFTYFYLTNFIYCDEMNNIWIYDNEGFTYEFNYVQKEGAVCLWNFGDGNNASGNSVSHTYNTEGIYLVTLVVTDSEGTTSYSQIIDCKNATSIPDINKISNLNIYPNPVENQLNITIGNDYNKELIVKIYSIEGKLIYESLIQNNSENQRFSFDVNNLDNGMYFIEITDGKTKLASGKFIK